MGPPFDEPDEAEAPAAAAAAALFDEDPDNRLGKMLIDEFVRIRASTCLPRPLFRLLPPPLLVPAAAAAAADPAATAAPNSLVLVPRSAAALWELGPAEAEGKGTFRSASSDAPRAWMNGGCCPPAPAPAPAACWPLLIVLPGTATCAVLLRVRAG